MESVTESILLLMVFGLAMLLLNLKAGNRTLKFLTYWVMIFSFGGAFGFLVYVVAKSVAL